MEETIMAGKAKRRKAATKRIYYGPEGHEKGLWWTVTVAPAKRTVVVDGEVLHALQATEGLTIGCALSNVAFDNAEAFSHPVYLAVFQKSIALLVDRLKKDGSPAHAVIYEHNYKRITECNDDGTLKRMVKDDPSIMQRKFILHPPRRNKKQGKTAGGRGNRNPAGRRGTTFAPQGALARAIRAGRIPAHVANQLTAVAKHKRQISPPTHPLS
jgi:hypothetical protein